MHFRSLPVDKVERAMLILAVEIVERKRIPTVPQGK